MDWGVTLVPFDCSFSRAVQEIDECVRYQNKSLNLDRLGLDYLPSGLSVLANIASLQRVDLSHNKLTFLPAEIGKLVQVKELRLCHNGRAPFLLSSELAQMSSLVNLKLAGNSLVSLPEELGELSDLKIIDISNNDLKELPKSFSKLKLAELRADNNPALSSLPPLRDSITLLVISYNPLLCKHTTLFPILGTLTGLQRLDLRGCELTEWPTSALSSLNQLHHLDLGDNRIDALPEGCLFAVPLLQRLYLDYNYLTELPDELGKLTHLNRLLVNGNKLQEIPLSFRFLTELKEFVIDEENMLIPPRDVVQKGLQAIRDFVVSLADESKPCNRIRLVVLGNIGSGKTSLIRRIRPGKNVRHGKGNANNESIPGDRVDIREIVLRNKQTDQSIVFSTWDFFFRETPNLRNIHRVFIAPRSVYIVTIDLTDPLAVGELDFWFQSICTRGGPSAPIFIVGTHADDKQFKEGGSMEAVLNRIAQLYSARYPNIRLVTATSAVDGSGIDELRASLIEEAQKHKHVTRIVPKPYVLLEEHLASVRMDMETKQQPPLLCWSEFRRIGAACHIHTDSTLRGAASFLCELGTVLSFHEEEEGIRNQPTLVLDPQWICRMVGSVIDQMNMNLTKTGVLNHAILGKVWKAPLYPPDIHKKCLAFMRDAGLSFPCEKDDGQDYLPSMLLSNKPDFQLIWFSDDVRAEYDRTWKFNFVPLGLLHHYIARMMELTQIHSIWEYGCVLSMKMDWALIEEVPSQQIIRIIVRSSFKDTPLLGFLLEMMEQLLTNYFPTHEPLKVFVRCSDCISQVEADLVTEFAVEELESALLNGQSTVTCPHTGTALEIATLAPDLALLQFSSFRIPLREIERESQKLAEGAYGILYRGVYKGEPIALKLLRLEEVAGEEQIAVFREFRREVSLMAGLRNENIVELKGFCFGDGGMGLVMDLVNSGDLHGLIKEKGRSMPPSLYLKLAFDIAQGLHFLHTLPTPILHRDLKPPNVLLSCKPGTNEYVAQLADFGLSAHQYFPVLRERAVETPMWVAPEILSGGAYASKSDVYAFGIILYEMTEGKMPFDSLDFDFRFLNQLEDEIISGKRGDLAALEATLPNVAQLIRSCWQSDPIQRPSCQQIMLMIISIAQKEEHKLYKQLMPRYKQINLKEKLPGTRLQGVGTVRATSTTVEGKLLKRLQTNPAEAVNCMILAGGDIWVAHRNGDISIWNSESGKLFRQIVAAHSREIQTMILVDTRVWTGSKDGMIRIWKARHFDDGTAKGNATAVKEGYLEPGDGSPAMFVSLKNGNKELIPNMPLLLSRTTAINEPKTGFNICLTDQSNHKFYCVNPKDRDEWVQAISYVAQNLCEETEDLSVGQIPPRKRRDQIHSLVYANGFVYVGISELVIRSYDANNLHFHGEYPIVLHSTWQVPARRASKRDDSTKSFAQTPSTSRRQIASVNFGKQRGHETPTVEHKSPQQLDEQLQVVSLIHLGNRYLWVVVHSFILRFSLEDVQAMGQLLGHEDQITALCNVGQERLWSVSQDKHIRVWDTKAMQCVRILSLEEPGFSLLRAGNTVWCGVGKDIQIYNCSNYTLQSTLQGDQTEPVTWMIIVWNRIVWSASEDKTICVWA